MEKFFLSVVCFLIASCSHVRPIVADKDQSIGVNDKKDSKGRPLWVNSPYDVCSERELCAVGEGSGSLNANANARQALAKIFSTQIKSKTTISKRDQTTSESEGVWQGQTEEDFDQFIQEKTEQILKGVEIKASFQDKTSVYALAVLDRVVAAKLIAKEMGELDERMIAAYKNDKRRSFF